MMHLKYLWALLLIIMIAANCKPPQKMSKAKAQAKLNHIAIYVSDLAKSEKFYSQVIGLDTIPEPFQDGKHVWYGLGPQGQIHLIAGAGKINEHNKNNHLCFSVASMADFISNLQKHGVAFENWAGEKGQVTNRVDGVKQIYFRDPDGYWIEVNDDH